MASERVEKTVFISYRRTNFPWAMAIYQDLIIRDYDVFFDVTGIGPGDFEQVILTNIRGRAHFLVLLTPSALAGCDEPGDWLRREIEAALDSKRNIVPIFLEEFSFTSPAIARHLTGKLELLKRYNGLEVPMRFFQYAMKDLHEKWLSVSLESVPHPMPRAAAAAAQAQKTAASTVERVKQEELTAQGWFERGYNATNPDEKIRSYSEAIRLQPESAEAFCNRGNVRYEKRDLDGSIADYSEAIRLKPDYRKAFFNRGIARGEKGDLDGAIADYDRAIRLKPDDGNAFANRGFAREKMGDLDGAIADYGIAIRLEPGKARNRNNRGNVRRKLGDLDGAIADYSEAIRLSKNDVAYLYNRGTVRQAKRDLDGAIRDFDKAIWLKPDYAEAFYNRGLARKANGDEDGAAEDLEAAKRLGFSAVQRGAAGCPKSRC